MELIKARNLAAAFQSQLRVGGVDAPQWRAAVHGNGDLTHGGGDLSHSHGDLTCGCEGASQQSDISQAGDNHPACSDCWAQQGSATAQHLPTSLFLREVRMELLPAPAQVTPHR